MNMKKFICTAKVVVEAEDKEDAGIRVLCKMEDHDINWKVVSGRGRMKKWQREVIEEYEQITSSDFLGKDEIHDDKSFWEKWDINLGWFSNVFNDVQNIINPFSHLRPEIA